MPGASASLRRAVGFLVHNLITDKLKSRLEKSFENLFVSLCMVHTNMSSLRILGRVSLFCTSSPPFSVPVVGHWYYGVARAYRMSQHIQYNFQSEFCKFFTYLICSFYYAPGPKGPPGASSNRIIRLSIHLSVCLSVILSHLQTKCNI